MTTYARVRPCSRSSARRNTLIGIVAFVLGTMATSACAQNAPSDQWQWSITPYLWLPTLNAKFRFELPPDEGGGTTADTEVGPSDYLSNLNGVLMVAGEMSRGRLTFGGDLIWISFTADKSEVRTVSGDEGSISIPRDTDVDTKTDLSGTAVTLSAAYALSDTSSFYVAALGGIRYFTLNVDVDWALSTTITGPGFTFDAEGKIGRDADLYDVIAGLRGKWWIGSTQHWYVPFYLDVGTGSSDLTWQAMAGGGYAFDQFDLLFVWRQLQYEQGSNDLINELHLGGPAFGFRWRFK